MNITLSRKSNNGEVHLHLPQLRHISHCGNSVDRPVKTPFSWCTHWSGSIYLIKPPQASVCRVVRAGIQTNKGIFHGSQVYLGRLAFKNTVDS